MKIDSQGYATVIPTDDHLDSDEIDCLQLSDDEECPVDPSQMVCRDREGGDSWKHHRENGYAPLTPKRMGESSSKSSASNYVGNDEDTPMEQPPPSPPAASTTPQDYEVPMNILQQSPSRSSTVISPRLTRQRAVSSSSEMETKRLSCVSNVDGDDGCSAQGEGERSGSAQGERDRSGSAQGERERTQGEKERSGSTQGERESSEECEARGGNADEVFDSGIENSVDSQDTASRTVNSRAGSESRRENRQQEQDAAKSDSATSSNSSRPFSAVVSSGNSQQENGVRESQANDRMEVRVRSETVSFARERQASLSSQLQPRALHISLDQNRQVIV